MARKRRQRAYIPRKEYRFWLRADREGEAQLMDYIAFLKQSRQFVTYVKRGLRLLGTLTEGDTSYLFELFPQLVERLNPPPAPPSPDELSRLAETAALKAAQQVILQMPAPGQGGLLNKSASGTLGSRRPLGQGVQFTAAPTGDEDDDMDVQKTQKIVLFDIDGLSSYLETDHEATSSSRTRMD